jgi:hypothetical protein
MRRWFKTPQWRCFNSICDTPISLLEILSGGTFFSNGKAECRSCADAGRLLIRVHEFIQKWKGELCSLSIKR